MYVSGPLRPHRLLVFINPFGGKRRGRKIYHSVVAPLFELAGISCHVIGKNDLVPICPLSIKEMFLTDDFRPKYLCIYCNHNA